MCVHYCTFTRWMYLHCVNCGIITVITTKGVSSRRWRREGMQRIYVNVKIQTWPPVLKISYTVYGYTMFAHARFTRASGCSYAIKRIHGRSQPPFPYTAVANIRKTPPCLNLDSRGNIWEDLLICLLGNDIS